MTQFRCSLAVCLMLVGCNEIIPARTPDAAAGTAGVTGGTGGVSGAWQNPAAGSPAISGMGGQAGFAGHGGVGGCIPGTKDRSGVTDACVSCLCNAPQYQRDTTWESCDATCWSRLWCEEQSGCDASDAACFDDRCRGLNDGASTADTIRPFLFQCGTSCGELQSISLGHMPPPAPPPDPPAAFADINQCLASTVAHFPLSCAGCLCMDVPRWPVLAACTDDLCWMWLRCFLINCKTADIDCALTTCGIAPPELFGQPGLATPNTCLCSP